jgi:2-dehydropantoate 2-reductase
LSERDVHVTIVGTGAMACLLAARLAPVAYVTLVGSWLEGLTAVRTTGIVVEGPGEHAAVRVGATVLGEAVEPADLVLILVKAWQTGAVAPHIARLLNAGGVALTLQNGLGNLEALGPRACLGVTYLGATLLGPGRVQPGGAGTTWIAGPEWVAGLFRRAGLEAERGGPEQVDGLLWGKLAVNCGINALTALLRVRNGELLRCPDARNLMRGASTECGAVAAAKGVVLPFVDPAERACQVAQQTADNRSSMLQDVLRGAPTECEAINGAVALWGRRLAVPVPINEVLFRLVRASSFRASATPDGGSDGNCRSSQVSAS